MELTLEDKQLIQAAKEVISKNYDNVNWWHTVGVAVRIKSGKSFVGVNCESVSHGSLPLHVVGGRRSSRWQRHI